MNRVFVYGTLLNDEVFDALIKTSVAKRSANLVGYKRVKVVGEVYPAIRPDGGGIVQGTLICGLKAEDLKSLDHYEGSYYKRVSVEVSLPNNDKRACETYVFRPDYYDMLSAEAWSNRHFRKIDMPRFLSNTPNQD